MNQKIKGETKLTVMNEDGDVVYDGEMKSVMAYLSDTTVSELEKILEIQKGRLYGDKKC